jgi:MFS family permease
MFTGVLGRQRFSSPARPTREARIFATQIRLTIDHANCTSNPLCLRAGSLNVISGWLSKRLPFFYGWVVIGVAFVTMAIGVNARTAFSLLYPSILDEFGWEHGVTAAAFSLGFVASIAVAPFTGVLMDKFGPRVIISVGAALVSLGLVLATRITTPLDMYLTLGGLVVGASVFMSYIGHSVFLPRWFDRRRGLAVGIAFSGVGVGSIILFPWVQTLINENGWRDACMALAVVLVVTIIPLNLLLQRTQPQDLGLAPDGAPTVPGLNDPVIPDNVVDAAWVNTEWTVGSALRTVRYWWMFLGLITALYAWYAVQVHQTRYFIENGFSATQGAFALGLVGLTGIIGQIGLGHLSDRIGREICWTIACVGFALSYGLLILIEDYPSIYLIYAVACTQGILGYGVAPIYSSIAAEIFQGRNFGAIFGSLSVATTLGAASGPWVTGILYDSTGHYSAGFALAIGLLGISCVAMWMAAPRKVRLVAGRADARAKAKLASGAHSSIRSGPSSNANASASSGQGAAVQAATTIGLDALPPATEQDKLHPPSRIVHTIGVRATPIMIRARESAVLTAFALDRNAKSVLSDVHFVWSIDDELIAPGITLIVPPEQLDTLNSTIELRAGQEPALGHLRITAVDEDGGVVGIERKVSVHA